MAKKPHERIPAPEGAMRLCRKCQQFLPWDEDTFGEDKARKDGWRQWCKACVRADFGRYKSKHTPKPPPVVKFLQGQALPPEMVLPKKATYREILEDVAGKNFKKLAGKSVELALDGDKQMMRLLMGYLLGTPREAAEESGPEQFYRAILAAARGNDAGDEPLGGALSAADPGDLGDGGLLTDPGSGESA